MDKITGFVLLVFIFFGWIPILAIGMSVATVMEAGRRQQETEEEE